MQRGYIKIWRKLEDSGLLQMHSTLALFIVMLMKSAYKPCRIGMVDIERGQLTAGRHQLAEWAGMSEQNVRTCLKNLHNLKILTSKATSKYTIYTFVNYGLYQDYDEQSTKQLTSNQPATNQQLTNNQPTTNQQLTTIKEANTLSIKTLNIKEGKNKPSTAFALPDWIDKNNWDLWMQTRKGKKMIPAQMQAQVNKLEKWKNSEIDHAAALAASAEAGWAGLFEPETKRGAAGTNNLDRQSRNEKIKEAAYKRIFGEEKIIESI